MVIAGASFSSAMDIELLDRDDLHVVGGGQPAAQTRRAIGREDMVRAGRIVSGGFGAVRADKDASRVANLRQQLFVMKTQVLRGEGVRQLHGFVERAHHDDRAVFVDRFARYSRGRKRCKLMLDLLSDLGGESLRSRQEERAGIGVMLGLCEHIGCDKVRPRPGRR